MDDFEFQVFSDTVNILSEQYPNRNINMYWDIDRYVVSVDNQDRFTTKGYNFLYCMNELIDSIKNELK